MVDSNVKKNNTKFTFKFHHIEIILSFSLSLSKVICNLYFKDILVENNKWIRVKDGT